MDAEKNVAHWKAGVPKALKATQYLWDGGFTMEALFWGHLAVEKALKAHVVKVTNDAPPHIHNLVKLAVKGEISFSEEEGRQLYRITELQLMTRYEDDQEGLPDAEEAAALWEFMKAYSQWLINKL